MERMQLIASNIVLIIVNRVKIIHLQNVYPVMNNIFLIRIINPVYCNVQINFIKIIILNLVNHVKTLAIIVLDLVLINVLRVLNILTLTVQINVNLYVKLDSLWLN